jgi:hypothetical protein
MLKRLAPLPCALLLLATSGCLFHRKQAVKEPKPSPYISTEVETQFEQRWEEKRTGDLVAAGMSPDAAKAQAEAEFKQKYAYAQPAPLKKK